MTKPEPALTDGGVHNVETVRTPTDTWRIDFCQTGLYLKPLTFAFCVVSSQKTCEAGVTSTVYRIVENPVVAHAAGFHFSR